MASNPMQRKTRNAFLVGFAVMLIIAILIGVVVYMLMIKPMIEEEKEEEQQMYAVYRLTATSSVDSGEEITSNMVEVVEIPATAQQRGDLIPAEMLDQSGNVQKIPFTGGNSKLALEGGTILTRSMLTDEEETPDSLRYVEYNMITMSTTLEIGEYVDLRLRLPNAQDFIVLSHKKIENIYGQTVGLNLTEDEIVLLNSAIVESYVMTSSEMYLAKYVEAGLQEKAEVTYVPTAEIYNLILTDPNIVDIARKAITDRFNANYSGYSVRERIDAQKAQYADEEKFNIEAGMQQQIENAREARQNYLSGLEGY